MDLALSKAIKNVSVSLSRLSEHSIYGKLFFLPGNGLR